MSIVTIPSYGALTVVSAKGLGYQKYMKNIKEINLGLLGKCHHMRFRNVQKSFFKPYIQIFNTSQTHAVFKTQIKIIEPERKWLVQFIFCRRSRSPAANSYSYVTIFIMAHITYHA